MNNFHENQLSSLVNGIQSHTDGTQFEYHFHNFFHPFVGDLIGRVNKFSVAGIFDADWQDSAQFHVDDFNVSYQPADNANDKVTSHEKEIDFHAAGGYSNYNWELFFHIPLMVATHLSKNQRFAEAQRWFHFIFNPTATGQPWNFLGFRRMADKTMGIQDIILALSDPSKNEQSDSIHQGYNAILANPFKPHVVARTRPIAYQYNVVMKYLDNLIAWGDSLFQQDTIETVNEATQIYVLAANVLGQRPQQMPPTGTVKPTNFNTLAQGGLGTIGDKLVDLEAMFPFNLAPPLPAPASGNATTPSAPLLGMGRALYFCVPGNDKLLSYWDTVGDRLFKIRHGLNIQGIFRQLPLFDPPIDPGMLVKAAAAGLDIGSILSGLNPPVGPSRCTVLIQKALELAGEVRSLGSALLSALEKADAEHLALVRQRHEIQIQQLTQEVRFLQWKQAQESTTSLLTSRATALERLRFYARLLNIPADQNASDTLVIDHSGSPDDPPKLTQDNFDEAYAALVGQYDKTLTHYDLPRYTPAGGDSPSQQAGATGPGKLYLSQHEDEELNSLLPTARDTNLAASVTEAVGSAMAFIPDADGKLQFWGLGAAIKVPIGTAITKAVEITGRILRTVAAYNQEQAGMASKRAGYERRADDWLLQYNLATHEIMQIGRQILTSLIGEQIAQHEYLNVKQQIANAQEIDQFLQDKFTNEDLYLWMQGQTSGLYYDCYRMACDVARKAEQAMKQELMRPELDSQDFIQFNYWDAGRRGLLSGDTLYLDVKRMEMAYLDNNKRELELVKNVSLRQLDPLALLALRTSGSCQVNIPEWLYDLDCPGHYMRRIKTVALSIPAVVGPYTSINCTLSLLNSSIRTSGVAGDNYIRQGKDDSRFSDFAGAIQSIVTSTGQNDSGVFELNLRDDRLLPFEGYGAISRWSFQLPTEYRTFDYSTITDVILHVRYTARPGLRPQAVQDSLRAQFRDTGQSQLLVLLDLRHDFPTEWATFINGNADLSLTIRPDHFPYFAQMQIKNVAITGIDLFGVDATRHRAVGDTTNATNALKANVAYLLSITPDATGIQLLTRNADSQAYVAIQYTL